jgi:large subunit ribosomal protein L31
MKANIHPKWYSDCKVTCACGNSFTVGATVPQIQVEVCSKCHPFYTGQMKYVDTAGRVDAFLSKRAKAQTERVSKTEKRKIKKQKQLEREFEKPDTLEELRKSAKSDSKKAKN